MESMNGCLPKLSVLALAIQIASGTAWAGPEGGKVVGGAGSIGRTNDTTVIQQMTDRMAINWNSYDVKANETVQYIQPDASSLSLNRILSNSGSEIHGSLKSNGKVILVNANGVMFGESARVEVGGMLASGLDLNPNDFMNGDFTLSALEGTEGKVLNSGMITASSGGSIALLGKQVENEGLIQAQLGTVTLAAGKEAFLTFDRDGMMGVHITQEVLQVELGVDAAVVNSGEIEAESGKILLSASVSGDIFSQAVSRENEAKSIIVSDDGTITLSAGSDVINTGTLNTSAIDEIHEAGQIALVGENITHSGSISADGGNADIELVSANTTLITGAGKLSAQGVDAEGGTIKLLGKKVGLMGSASIQVDGKTGGGDVYVGGGKTGDNPWLPNAGFVYTSEDAQIGADATDQGDGGKVVFFAENTARINGQISARGGILGGDGGFIETSGLSSFEITSVPNAGAQSETGSAGLWLIDPTNVWIVNNGSATGEDGPFSFTGVSNIGVNTISSALLYSDVTISTTSGSSEYGNITFNATLQMHPDYDNSSINTPRRTLTLNAENNINLTGGSIYADRDTSSGASFTGLNIILNADSDNGGQGTFTQSNGNDIISGGGSISISGNDFELTGDGGFTSIFNNRPNNAQSTGGAITLDFKNEVKIATGDNGPGRIKSFGNNLSISGKSIEFGNGTESNGTYLEATGSSSILALRAADTIKIKDNILATEKASIQISGLIDTSNKITNKLGALNFDLEYKPSVTRSQVISESSGVSLAAEEINLDKDTSIVSSGTINLSGQIDGDGLVKITGAAIQGVGVDIETDDGKYIDIQATGGSINLNNLKVKGTGTATPSGIKIVATQDVSLGDVDVSGVEVPFIGHGKNAANFSVKAKNISIKSISAHGSDGKAEVLAQKANGGAGGIVFIEESSGVGSISVGSIKIYGGAGGSFADESAEGGNAGTLSIKTTGNIALSGNIDARPGEDINVATPNSGEIAKITLQANSYTLADNITIDTRAVNAGGTAGLSGNAADIRFTGEVNGGDGNNALTIKARNITFKNADDALMSIGQSHSLGGLTLKATGAIEAGDISTAAPASTTDGEGVSGGDINLEATRITVGSLDSSGADASGSGDYNGGSAGTIDLIASGASTDYFIVVNGNVRAKGGVGVNSGAGAELGTATIALAETSQDGSLYLGSDQNGNGSLEYFFEATISATGSDAGTDKFYGPVFQNSYSNTLAWTINQSDATSQVAEALPGATGPEVTLGDFDVITGSSVDDNFKVIASGDVDYIAGGDGENTLQAPDTVNTWLINDANNVNSNSAAVNSLNGYLEFDDMQVLHGGVNGDTFTVTGTLTGLNSIDGDVTGGTSVTDSVILSGVTDTSVLVSVGGAVSNSTLAISGIESLTGSSNATNTLAAAGDANLDNTWLVSGNSADATADGTLYYNAIYDLNGNVNSFVDTLQFYNFENLTGGGGVDQFSIDADVTLTGTITGGGGSNTLTANNNSSENYNWILTSLNAGQLDYVESDGIDTSASGAYTRFSSIQSLTGTGTGEHVLTGRDQNSNWRINTENAGTLALRESNGNDSTTDTLSFVGMSRLQGGAANDWFIFTFTSNSERGVTTTVDGGSGGSDTLIGYNGKSNRWDLSNDGKSGNLFWLKTQSIPQHYTDFLEIENFTGGGSDELDLSNIASNIAVTLGTLVETAATNDREITANGFGLIKGNYDPNDPASFNALFIVNDGGKTDWTIDADNSGTITHILTNTDNPVTFENFNQLLGDEGVDTFTIINADSNMFIDAGSGSDEDVLLAATNSDNYWRVYEDVNNSNFVTGELSNGTDKPSGKDARITFTGIDDVFGENEHADHFAISTLGSNMGFDAGDQVNKSTPEIVDIADFSLVKGTVDIALDGNTNATWVAQAERIIGNGQKESSLTGSNEGDDFTLKDTDGVATNLDGYALVDGTERTEFQNFSILNGGGGADSFNLADGEIAYGVLYGGADGDTFTIAAGAPLTVYGHSKTSNSSDNGNDKLILISPDTASANWILGQSTKVTSGISILNFFQIESVQGIDGKDTFTITETGVNTIYGGGGDDEFIVSTGLALQIFGGTQLQDSGNDTLKLEGDDNATWHLNADTSEVISNSQTIEFKGIESVSGGAAEDTFYVSTEMASIDGGDDNSDSVLNTLVNQSTASQTWTIDEQNGGKIGSFVASFSRIDNLIGNSQEDTFAFSGTATVNGLIDGENPTGTPGDILDLRAFTANYAIDYSNGNNSIAGVSFTIDNIETIYHGTATGQTRTLVGPDAGWDWYIIGTDIVRIGTNGPQHTGFNSLFGGSGDDHFYFENSGTLTGEIQGGDASGTDASGTDEITGPVSTSQAITDWKIDGTGSGDITVLANTIEFTGIETLIGRDSEDTFTVTGASTIDLQGGFGGDQFTIRANSPLTGSISGGSGQDRFNFASAVTGTVDGGAGNDEFIIETATADFDVEGGGNTDTLTLGYSFGADWVLPDEGSSTVTEKNTTDNQGYTVTFDAFEILNGSKLDDTLTINAAHTNIRFNGRNGIDTVTSNVDTETIWTINENTGQQSSIVGNGLNIVLSAVEKLVGTDARDTFDILTPLHSINSKDGNDTLNISATITDKVASSTDVQTGNGNDTININTAGISFSLNGGGEINTLVANDADAEDIWRWNIASDSSLDYASAKISFSNITNIVGSEGQDHFAISTDLAGGIQGRGSDDVFLIAANVANGIDGGAGDDRFNLNAKNLNILISGGTSTTGNGDKLVSGLEGDFIWRITSNSVLSVLVADVTNVQQARFNGIEAVTGHTGSDRFEITQEGTSVAIVGGDDTAGSDTLVISDKNSQGTSWTVAATNSLTYKNQAYSSASVSFEGIEILQGGNADDTFIISNAVQRVDGADGNDDFTVSAAISDNLYGGNGDDTVTLAASDFELKIYGGSYGTDGANGSDDSQNDTVIGDNSDHRWNITGNNTGNIDNKIDISGIENMTGGSGNDTFVFDGNYLLDGVIDGGAHVQDLKENKYGDVIDARAINEEYTRPADHSFRA